MNDTISGFRGPYSPPSGKGLWQTVLKIIKSDKYKKLIEYGRTIKEADKYRKFKTTLPAITFSGTFKPKRKNEYLDLPTGFIIPDIDHIKKNIDIIFDLLKQDSNIWFVFHSPSGEGLKAGIRAQNITNDIDHKKFYFAVEYYFQDVYGIKIDPACKDIARLTFMSWDEKAWVNPDPQWFNVSQWKPLTPSPRVAKPIPHTSRQGCGKYAQKVLEGCCEKIRESLPGDQHRVRLKAARLIGGYLQYIDETEVLFALEQAVIASGAERIGPAMKTIRDGLTYGKTEPIVIPDMSDRKTADPHPGQQAKETQKEAALPVKQKEIVRVSIKGLIETKFKPEELILSPWLPTQGVCMIHARPGVGKTFLAIGIGFAVAAGTKFLKWEAPQARGVLYVDGEMAGDDIKKRYEKIIVEHGFALPDKTLDIITPDLNEGQLPDIGTKAGQKIIESQITDDMELIILDNLSCLQRTGIENEAEGWRIMQEWLLHLKARGKAVLLVHHSGKGGSQRGSSKREDFLNTILTLKRNPAYEFEEGAQFEIHYEKARSVYGAAARPFEAKLDIIEGVWTIKDLKTVTYDQVVRMKKDEATAPEIAKALEKDKSVIYKYIKKAKEKGDL